MTLFLTRSVWIFFNEFHSAVCLEFSNKLCTEMYPVLYVKELISSIFKYQAVDILGTFIYCIFSLHVTAGIKTGTFVEICFRGLAVHVFWFSAAYESCLPHNRMLWELMMYNAYKKKSIGSIFIPVASAADLAPHKKEYVGAVWGYISWRQKGKMSWTELGSDEEKYFTGMLFLLYFACC